MHDEGMKKEILESMLKMVHELMARGRGDKPMDLKEAIAEGTEAAEMGDDDAMEENLLADAGEDEAIDEAEDDEELDEFEQGKRDFFLGKKKEPKESATLKLKMAAAPLPKFDMVEKVKLKKKLGKG